MRFFLVAFTILFLGIAPVYAHESKQSGDTIVFVHTNPNDQAVTGKRGTFYILITKNRYQFPIDSCTCTATVLDSKGNTLSSSPFKEELGKVLVPYFFTSPGIYFVRIDGTPKAEGVFEPFSLSFSIRVERGSYLELLRDRRYVYGALGVVSLLFIVGVYTKKYLSKKSS